MATTIEVINQKLDLAQSKFQEIDNLKENLKDLQKETINLKESISFAHKEIAKLKEISQFQEGVIKALQIGVNGLLMVCLKKCYLICVRAGLQSKVLLGTEKTYTSFKPELLKLHA